MKKQVTSIVTQLGRLLVLFIFASFVMVTHVEGQTKEVKITLSCNNEPMPQVLKKVEKLSKFKVLFTYDEIANYKVSLDLKEASISKTLSEIIGSYPLKYSIRGSYITISQKSIAPNEKMISGSVKDIEGEPLPGARVSIKGASVNVASDVDGLFYIIIPASIPDAVLVFDFIGMKSREINVAGIDASLPLNVVMDYSKENLEEVVVTGIFERKKESYTGAATVIKKEDLVVNGNQNVIQNIKNIDPSFKVFDNINFGSDPNKMPEIQMRGQQSIPDIKGTYDGNPNQPLFILDGFESDISTIFDLDLNRIETVVLLKDAAAKAIYGARAANGVVVIETKKPEPGKMRFTYKGDLSITIPDLNGYNLCNAKEKYVVERDNASSQYEYFRERYLNYILEEITRGIDTYWLSIPLHVGIGHKHSVYLEGGDDRIRYGLDVMYNDISGAMKKSGRETFSGGFSLSYRYKKLLFRNQLSVVLNKAKDSPYGSFSEYTSLNPYWTPYNEDGSIKKILGTIGGGGLIETPISNPMWNAHINTKNFDKYTKLINNFYIEWNILDNLKLIGRLGLTKNQSTREDFYPANHTYFANYEDEKFFERGSYNKSVGDNIFVRGDLNLNYSFLKEKNQLYLNVGVNSQQNKSENETFSVIGFPNDKMDFIAFGKEYPLNSRPYGYESISREIGILSAMNYSYDNRFLADASYRASASSLFGKDSRWGHFWSVGFGWNIHNESFFKGLTWLKQFKVRASTGYTGSQNFNSYQALATFAYYQSQSYDNWIGSYLKGLPNNDLRWQKTQDYNLGVDLNFLGKISVRFDYYTQNTKDQLLDLTIPPSMGFTSYKENIGSTQNRGMELKVSSQVFSETNTNSYVNLFFSIARNKNKIKKISNALKSFNDANDKQLETGSHNDVIRPLVHYVEGQSLSSIWAVRSLGIDPASGKELFLTKDGRITSVWNVNDQVVCGDAMPKCSGSFGVNADYKGFFLNISMYYQLGSQMYNQTLVDRVENAYIPLNVDKRIYNAVWKQPNDIVSFSYDRFKTTKPTSRFVQDLNELTLSSLNFGYDFRNTRFIKSLGVSQLKASIYMENVFRASSVKTERGLSYPFARTYSFSIQTTF